MKKKIAILLPKISEGGTERVASTVSLNLPERFDQYLFIYFIDKVDYEYKAKIINMNRPIKRNYLLKFINFIIRYKKLAKLKTENEIEVSISFGPNVENVFSKQNDVVINTVHNVLSVEFTHMGLFGTFRRIFARLFYNRSDIIVTVSKFIKNDLIKNFNICPDKIRVIYNPHNIAAIVKACEEPLEPEFIEIYKKPTIISAGRLSFQKGQWFLIRIMSQLVKTIPDIQLVILGNGPCKDYLQQMIEYYKLENNVHLIDFQKNPHKHFRNAKMFALTSIYEGFPNVLVEALACSVPIVSVDCKSGPRELMAPTTEIDYNCTDIEFTEFGILTPNMPNRKMELSEALTSSELKFAEAVIKLIQSPYSCEKYIEKGLKRAYDFDVSKVIEQYVEMIDCC